MAKLPLDLSKFKKVSSDGKSTTLEHSDGHSMTVAHAPLSPKFREQLAALPLHKANGGGVDDIEEAPKKNAEDMQRGAMKRGTVGEGWQNFKEGIGLAEPAPASEPAKPQPRLGNGQGGYAKGGQVKHYADGSDQPVSQSAQDSPEQIAKDAASQPQQAPQPTAGGTTVINIGSQQPTAPSQQGGNPYFTNGTFDFNKYALANPNTVPLPAQTAALQQQSGDAQFQEQSAQKANAQQKSEIDAYNAQAQKAGLATRPYPQGMQSPAASPTSGPAGEVAGPSTQPPQEAPQDADPYGTQKTLDYLEGGVQKQKAGINEAATAAGNLGKQQAALNTDLAGQQQKNLEDFQSNSAQFQKDYSQVMQEIRDQKIDPNRFWNSKDTGGKISTAIGLILGGLSGADVGKFLNDNINRDIESQKMELGQKQTLLDANLARYKNQQVATDMTRVMMNGIVAHKLDAAAAASADPMAKARAKAAIGQLESQNAQALGQAAARRTLMSHLDARGNPETNQTEQYLAALRQLDPKKAEELQKRYVPGVGVAQVEVPQATRDIITARKVLGDNIQQLISFQKKYGGSLEGILDPKVRAQGEALAKQVQDQYRRANAQGVFKPAEAEFVNGVIADSPSSLFSKYTKAPAYQAAAAINQGNYNSLLDSIGIRRPQGSGGSAPKTFKFK